MAEKTIQGKKCPHCSSFVKNGLKTCPVCGFELTPGLARTRPEMFREGVIERKTLDIGDRPGIIVCGKCGTENGPDFRFCKICKHPLQDPKGEEPPGVFKSRPERQAEIKLMLEWKKIPTGFQAPDQIALQEFKPYFNGAGEWQGYAFFVLKTERGGIILIRKTDPASASVLFRKRSGVFLIESGTEFYLGTTRFQVLGDLSEKSDTRTVLRSEKTVLKDPGERDTRPEKKGLPRIKPLDLKSSAGESVIREKILLGRDWLVNNLGCGPEEMRKNGISGKHAHLSPLNGGLWLLEPLTNKPVFETIDRVPVELHEGDCLCYRSPLGPVELTISLKPGRD